ncbi:MAG: ATP-binding protein [Clostridia bacterium]|nr:ATP-binding protein [Clostridia bacterium]
MINRKIYMEKLYAYKDTEFIKVITGIRRCGKSSILKLFMEKILEEDKSSNIIYMNFESFEFDEILNYKDMYNSIKNKIKRHNKNYILLDEVQRVHEWEKCVNSLMVDFDTDIYITGSNAYLLSSELSTYLSGRYIEIKMLPLSFKEFLDFSNFDNNITLDEKFNTYLKYGGMPGIITLKNDNNLYENVIRGIYNTVFMKDVVEKNKLIDASLLEKVLKFLMSNIGSLISSKKIADYLVSQGTKVTHNTILSYLTMLENAYIIYKAPRYDIKGKELLKTLEKYYIIDTGIRNVILGFRDSDYGHIIENIVYFELLRRGYDVTVGKTDSLEVDFIATNSNEKKYYQVTLSILDENVKNRELKPLRIINDNFEKTIITLDKTYNTTFEDGIKIKELKEFLLEE